MKEGQQVQITVDAIPDQKFRGYINSFSPGTGSTFALLPPGQRHREFHQDRAARAGEDPFRPRQHRQVPQPPGAGPLGRDLGRSQRAAGAGATRSLQAFPLIMAAQSGEKQVSTRQWIALFGAMLGAFMAVLDIQITNSSLADISGAIGSSIDEGSWISTAYLCAEIVAIGISGIMASIFSIRRYLLVSAIGFLIFSLLCAFCTNLSELIACRALQGLFGGALIPLAFNIILVLLPPVEAAGRPGHLRHDGDLRPVDRAVHRRLADRQLGLAVDFLHQPAARPRADRHHLACSSTRTRCISTGSRTWIISASSPWPSASARSNTCWRRATQGLVRERHHLSLRLDRRDFHHAFSHSRTHREEAVPEPETLQVPNVRALLHHPDGAWAWGFTAPFSSCRNISPWCRSTAPGRSAPR